MKAAIYVSSWPPGQEASGIITYCAELVSSLRARGHEVYVVTPSLKKRDPYSIEIEELKDGVLRRVLRRLQAKLTSVPLASIEHSNGIYRTVRDLVADKGVEVFEMEEAFGWSAQIAKANIVPVVVRLHGPFIDTGRFNDADSYQPVQNKRAEQEGKGISAAHFVMASSSVVLNTVKDHYGLDLSKNAIIPLPIDAASPHDTWRAGGCDKNSILYIGRFDSIKGGDLALKAFAKLAARNPELRLTFVGPDQGLKTEGEPLRFEEFVRQNFDEAIRSRIDYRGQMAHPDLMALRTSHYLTLVASQYETMGYMLLEAMSLGCPIVSTAVGGIPEVIQDGCNGLLVPSQDETAMVAACQRLLDDSELAGKLGHQAWLDCQKLYSPDTVVDQTLEVYEQAISAFKANSKK